MVRSGSRIRTGSGSLSLGERLELTVGLSRTQAFNRFEMLPSPFVFETNGRANSKVEYMQLLNAFLAKFHNSYSFIGNSFQKFFLEASHREQG